MRICIDSCVFIRGIHQPDSLAAQVLKCAAPERQIVIPRLIAQKVSRNLVTPAQRRAFYRLFQAGAWAVVVDAPTPPELVAKYVNLGLRAKADAFIGAFTEWVQADYLISLNRHFLQELASTVFEVLDPATFLTYWRA